MSSIVFASGNPGKIREVADLFAEFDVTVIPQGDLGIESPEETESTFVGNALLKARHAASISGLPAIADDSGIAVDALQGRPGVWSARYAGEDASDSDNVDKLLAELAEVADSARGAGFHCAAVLVDPQASTEPLVAEGVWRGTILRERVGDGGFGYDPVFFDPELGCSSAELSAADKDARSHRGKAMRELARQLRDFAWPQA